MREKHMKKKAEEQDDMLPEYDFRAGVRGEYADAFRKGYTVTVHEADGSTTVQHFKPDEEAIVLEPDVREYFPDSESVNKALRSLIEIAPRRRRRAPSGPARARKAV